MIVSSAVTSWLERLLQGLRDVVGVVGGPAQHLAARLLVEVATAAAGTASPRPARAAGRRRVCTTRGGEPALQHAEHPGDHVDDHDPGQQVRRAGSKSMPWPGTTSIGGQHVGPVGLALRRAAASTACSLADAGGQRLADHAGEDDVGGVAEQPRPDHRQGHAGDAEQQHQRRPARAPGASMPSSRLVEPLKSCSFSVGIAARPSSGRPAARPIGRPGAGLRVGRGHAAASCSVSWDRTISRYVGLPSISSAWVPVPTTRPSSSTTIRSASRIVLTRWATMTTVASAMCAAQRRPQRRVGGVVERRERVVEQVDLRPVHQHPGDREPLPLAAGDVGAALGDRRVQPALHPLDEVAGLGDLERLPTARSSVASGLPYRRLEATVPVNRYGRCGTRPTVRDSSAGSSSRTSTPSTSTVPPVASNSRGTRLSSVVLPLPVLPMTAVISPRPGDQVDAAAAPAPRRPG